MVSRSRSTAPGASRPSPATACRAPSGLADLDLDVEVRGLLPA